MDYIIIDRKLDIAERFSLFSGKKEIPFERLKRMARGSTLSASTNDDLRRIKAHYNKSLTDILCEFSQLRFKATSYVILARTKRNKG